MKHKHIVVFIGAIGSGVLLGLLLTVIEPRVTFQLDGNTGASTQHQEAQTTSGTRNSNVRGQEAMYIVISRSQMIDRADAIFLGKVASIAKTRWNQDSGEPWMDAANSIPGPDDSTPAQFHTITVDVITPIAAPADLGQAITITVLGPDPSTGDSDHSLEVGDEAVFFLISTQLTWRDGTRPIWRLLNAPEYSYDRRGSDGLFTLAEYGQSTPRSVSLDTLLAEVAARRPVLSNSE